MSEKIEHELNATSFAGEASGWSGAAAMLRQEAADAFLRDDEEIAHTLKRIATDFDRQEREVRVRQREEDEKAEEVEE